MRLEKRNKRFVFLLRLRIVVVSLDTCNCCNDNTFVLFHITVMSGEYDYCQGPQFIYFLVPIYIHMNKHICIAAHTHTYTRTHIGGVGILFIKALWLDLAWLGSARWCDFACLSATFILLSLCNNILSPPWTIYPFTHIYTHTVSFALLHERARVWVCVCLRIFFTIIFYCFSLAFQNKNQHGSHQPSQPS